MQKKEDIRPMLEKYIIDRQNDINSKLKHQQILYEVTKGEAKKPIREPRKNFTRKTRENLERLKDILCGNTKFDCTNIKKLLLDYERYKILIDFYIVADGLKIDQAKRKNPENKNYNIRFMDSNENYFFAMPIDKFIELRGGTRGSISRNINLFVFLGLIEKKNPYQIESASIMSQENNRQDKINMIDIAVNKGKLDLKGRKNDFNFLTLYVIPKLKNQNFKIAEDKATRLFQVNFSIRAFTSIFLVKYFGFEDASKVYFHKNLIGFTQYSDFLQNKIKDAVIEQISKYGYTTKSRIYNQVKMFCSAKEFEIIERYGRPRVSRKNTFETEYKRILGEILQENKYIRLSSTPTQKMKDIFQLVDCQHILYDIKKLERGNNNGK